MENYEKYIKVVERWNNLSYPARPSKEEMIMFNKLMQGHKGEKLLILGSTPEFRDLGFQNKLKVTCADINSFMMEGMKQIMKQPNDKEILIKCDWQHMPFKNNSFDLVFAEQSLNVVKTESYDEILKEIKRVMKSKGLFVFKSLNPVDEKKEDIIEKYRKEKRDVSFLYDRLANRKELYKDKTLSHTEIGEDYNRLLKQKKMTPKEHKELFDFWGDIIRSDLTLFTLEKKEFDKLLKKYFKIKETLYGEDFEKHKTHPIYVLEKE